jgi:hypothetical protein
MAHTHAWDGIVHDMRDEFRDLATIAHVDAARRAWLALWLTCAALPLVFGLDKFAGVMTDTWERYLTTGVNDVVPGTAADAMLWVGAIEIILAALILAVPRIGGDLFGLWMVLVAINLFALGGVHELAVGCIAIAIMAFAMAHMSKAYHHTESEQQAGMPPV